MRRLVILRPEPGASATAMEAAKLGLDPVVLPLFAVEPITWSAPDPGDFDALLLTSANSVRHGGPQLERVRSLPAHCVGQATAAAALDAGFKVAGIGAAGVDALLSSLPPDLRLLHLCGADRRDPIAAKQSIRALPIYRAAELPFPESRRDISGTVVAVHSPKAASRLSQIADQLGLARETISIAAISEEAAQAAGRGWQAVEAAGEPSEQALLALAARLCQNPG